MSGKIRRDGETDMKVESKSDDFPQCAVFFEEKQWSSRYATTFFTAAVKNFEVLDSGGFVAYSIPVKCNTDSWLVKRRFSDFDRLLSNLRAVFRPKPGHSFPPLPSKTFSFHGPTSQEFCNLRLHKLQIFFERLVSIPSICESKPLRDFLDLDRKLRLKPLSTEE